MATRTVGPGKTYSTISAAITAASTGDTIEIYPATYTEQAYFNKTIYIVLPEPGTVKVVAPASPATASVFIMNANCTLTGHVNAILHIVGDTTNTAYGALVVNGSNAVTNITVLLSGKITHIKNWGANVTINRLISVDCFNALDNRGSMFINNAAFVGSTAGDFLTNGGGTGTLVIDSFLCSSAKRYNSFVDNGDNFTFRNGVFTGVQTQFSATGTNSLTRDHNVIFKGGRTNGYTDTGTGYRDGGFNITGDTITKPYILGPRKGGYDNGASVSIVIDDGVNIPTFEALCGYLDQYNLKATLAVVNTQMTGDYWPRLKALTDRGHGAVSHTWNHCNLRTLAGFWLKYNGSGTNPVISFDGTTLSGTANGGVDSFSFPVTGYTYIYDLCAAFATTYGAADKWRIQTYQPGPTRIGYTAANITGLSNAPDYDYVGQAHTSALATFSNQACSTVYTALLDLATFMQVDLVASRDDINTRLGLQTGTFVYPGSYIHPTQAWDNYFEEIGFIGARSVSNRYETFDLQPNVSIPIFYTGAFAVDNFLAAGDATAIKSMVNSWLQWVITTGAKACILGHGLNPTSGWQQIVEAIAESGVNVVLYDDQIKDIRRNWVRDTSKGWPEYKMAPDSYALLIKDTIVNAVVNPEFQGVGQGSTNLTTDINGKKRLTPPTIGPLEVVPARKIVTSRTSV